MVNKKHENLLNITGTKEMLTKSTIRYYFIFTRIAIIKKIDKTSVGEDAEKLQPSYIAGGN